LQEGAPKFLARGWPALWKIASRCDYLNTSYPIYSLYLRIESVWRPRPEFNSPDDLSKKSVFPLEFCCLQTCSDGTIAN